jgi:signal transduction histidine kinase
LNTALENEIARRFGVLPNFFRLASSDPGIAVNFWGFAQFAYLNNPLPSLFKERLFVYLSRFCEVRYCIARHVGFLVGLGYPAGDSTCIPLEVEAILPLLRRPLAHGDELILYYKTCESVDSPLSDFAEPDSPKEQAIFACATHVFLQTCDASRAHEALRCGLGAGSLEQLNLFLAFVRVAHYWTKLHPELTLEDDINQLLATHEALAQCILKEPEVRKDSLSVHVEWDLASLREKHEGMTQAYQELSFDHQFAKHSLHETQEKLRELISVMPAAVYSCDHHGVITYYNRQAVEIWGRMPKPDDAPWWFLDSCRLYPTESTPMGTEDIPLRAVLATGVAVVNLEMVLERPDLSRVNILANITALRDSKGAVRAAVSILQDITELKRIQHERENLLQELERSNRELSQFSYGVSHDLRAPVRNILSLTQLLKRRKGGSEEESSHVLTMIGDAAEGMDRLIEALLGYAQAGQGQLRRRRVPAEATVECVRETLSPLIAKSGAQIICESLPVVEADPVLLQQLLQNLVANAIQYHRSGEAPVISISAAPFEGGWKFSVRDNGQGIPALYQESVFEPLKRLHGNENPGTGLGLALCRTIVARHGGRIWIESEGSGRGATFFFTLPLVEDSFSSAAARA